MICKKLVLVSVLGIGAAMLSNAANATTYVSDGTSFAALANMNTERINSGTFESFTRSVAAHQQATDVKRDNDGQDKSPGVSKEDTWLMLLISGVLVGLQLRRKQKSLPHQPLVGATPNSLT